MTDSFDILHFIPAVPLSQLPPVQAYLKALSARQRTELLQRHHESSGLSDYGQKLLAAKPENLYAPVAWLWKLIGDPGYSVQMAVRSELQYLEFAAFVDPRIGRANVALMAILDKGWEYLKQPQPENRGREDIAHDHASNWIRMKLERQGLDTRCEPRVPGARKHYADVGYVNNGKLHLYEGVYKSQANLVSHLSACFIESSSVATVTVVAFTKKHLAKLQQLVGSERSLKPFADRIHFEVIEPYMRELFG